MKKNKITFADLKRFARIKHFKQKQKDFKMREEGVIRIYELEEGDKFEMDNVSYIVGAIREGIMYYSPSTTTNKFKNTMSHNSFKLIKLLK